MKTETRITFRAFFVGVLFSAIFAALTVYFSNVKNLYISSTQIPVMPYALLFLTVLVLNPLCRLVRIIRPFATAEILVIFTMGLVSCGISIYGLSAQLVPIVGGLFNGRWNTSQVEWNRYVEPFVNEQFFVSEPGIQQAAAAYRVEVDKLRAPRAVYDSAIELAKARGRAEAAEAALRAAESSNQAAAEKAMSIDRAKGVLRIARDSLVAATADWETKSSADVALKGMSTEAIEDLIGKQEVIVKERQATLAGLEAKAFEKVNQFRRGFPREVRAFPGIFPTVDDSYKSYVRRLERLCYGKKAIKELRAAYDAPDSPDKVRVHVEQAISNLKAVDREKELLADEKSLNEQIEDLRSRIVSCDAELNSLYDKSRFADPGTKRMHERQISGATARKARLQKEQKKVSADLEHVNMELATSRRLGTAIEGLSGISRDLGDPAAAASGGTRERLAGIMTAFPSFDVSLTRYFVGDVPWRVWMPSLLRWGLLILLTYAILMALNVLIFRQWAHHEKLIYPLAQLPEDLAGLGSGEDGSIPRMFRSGLFWAGAGISGCVLGWNLFCVSQVVPGLKPIDINNTWRDFIINSPLQGLLPSAKSSIFFTMIGVSFLIPQKISFSLWFFVVLYMVQLLVMVGLGYGVSEDSFPRDWWYTMNFRTAEGGGALLVFSTVVLFKCRKYILCFMFPSSVSDLEPAERQELRASSLVFLVGSIALILVQWLGMKANLAYVVFFYVVFLLITIGLIRAVAEGGIISFQAWSNPFHLIRTILGMDKAWTAPSLFAPLMVYYAVFFYDLKTFIAPAMANGLKIRDDLKMKRRGFHLAVISAILIAVLVAVGAEIMLSYYRGADNMEKWFYTDFPGSLFSQMSSMEKDPPGSAPAERLWIGVGAGTMAALLYFRQTLFWLPHPIGMIMLVSPIIMSGYWFSIFLGWLAKSLVTKYGNKDTYARVRCLFIGLIFGELLLVIMAMICAAAFNVKSRIDLNWPSILW